MAGTNPDQDLFRTISNRFEVIEEISRDRKSKQALVDELSISRSTVDRAIRELESFGLVDRTTSGFTVTTAGHLAYETFLDALECIDAIDQAGQLLRFVPEEAPMDIAMIEGAAVYEPQPHAPNEPIEAIIPMLQEAERFRGFAAAHRLSGIRDVLYERTMDGTLDAEAVFTDDLVDFLLQGVGDMVVDVIEEGGFEFYANDSIPYGLAIIDTPDESTVFLIVYGEGTSVKGVIENDSPAALDWARSVYRRYRANATPVDPVGS